ncbi:hypothetical protein HBB16_10605 [Pseudonocardia sp. MCCB 268]|nr:hypothetical protein [Pseudonocardia cytotoxica]
MDASGAFAIFDPGRPPGGDRLGSPPAAAPGSEGVEAEVTDSGIPIGRRTGARRPPGPHDHRRR